MAEVVEWTVWPWAEDRSAARFVSAGMVFLAIATLYLYSQSLILSTILGGVLLLALGDYFFPVKYLLTEEGLSRVSLYGRRTVKRGAEIRIEDTKIFFGRMRVFIPQKEREVLLEALKRAGRPAGVEAGGSGEDGRQGGQMGGSSGV